MMTTAPAQVQTANKNNKKGGTTKEEASAQLNALSAGADFSVFEAHERPLGTDVPISLANSALEYELRLTNGTRARCVIYIVYAEPMGETGKETLAKPTNDYIVYGEGKMWLPVTRERCNKSCEGPILSAIQRFGKQGRTQSDDKSGTVKAPEINADGKANWKNSRNLFISIDEASNHVRPFGPDKVKAFRLLFSIFDMDAQVDDSTASKLLGTGFSTPIRVFANNDVPKGAAAMQVRCSLGSSWSGWKSKELSEDQLKAMFGQLAPEKGGQKNEEKKATKNGGAVAAADVKPKKRDSMESAEEKKNKKLRMKASKELEKIMLKSAKTVAQATALLSDQGAGGKKRKNGIKAYATGNNRAKKAKTGALKKHGLSQAEIALQMHQMYQPYFVPPQSGDIHTNNVSSIFSPMGSGRFPSSTGVRRLSDQHVTGFSLNELNTLQTPATNGKNGSPGGNAGTPPSNVNSLYAGMTVTAAQYAQQQEHIAAAAILSMGTPPDQQLRSGLNNVGDSTLMRNFTVGVPASEFISTADLPAMCTPPGGSGLMSPADAFLRTIPNLTSAKPGRKAAAGTNGTAAAALKKNTDKGNSLRFGNTPAANMNPTMSTMKLPSGLPSIGSLGSAFKQTSPTAAAAAATLNTTVNKTVFSRNAAATSSQMFATNAAATTATATTSKRQFREKSVVASHRVSEKEVTFAKDTISNVNFRRRGGQTTTTTTAAIKNNNIAVATTTKNNTLVNGAANGKKNENNKVAAALVGRKVRGRKNSLASVGADLAPTRLHFGGLSSPPVTTAKNISLNNKPMTMLLDEEKVDVIGAGLPSIAFEKPKAARLSSWFRPPPPEAKGGFPSVAMKEVESININNKKKKNGQRANTRSASKKSRTSMEL
jgi:hypothetical protein